MSEEKNLDEIKKFWPKEVSDIKNVPKYIKKYKEDLIVIKYGGNVLIDRKIFNNFIEDIDILNKLGAETEIENNSLLINGTDRLYYTNNISNCNDHRLAMMIYSSHILSGETATYDKCIDVSFPEFHSIFKRVIVNK